MQGTFRDVVTEEIITDGQIAIQISEDETRVENTDDSGEYRIKKEGDAQQVTFSAAGYEDQQVVLEDQSDYNVFLVPTAEETAGRIIEAMREGDYATAYLYLHPNYISLYDESTFEEINVDSGYEDFIRGVQSFEVINVRAEQSYRDANLRKGYEEVTLVSLELELNASGTQSSSMVVPLVKESVNGKTYWRWLFNRTTNSSS